MANPKKERPEAPPEGASSIPISDDYLRSVAEMKNIGSSFRYSQTFRNWLRDFLYDTTRLVKDVCWKVVESEASAAVAGGGLGSKQDVLLLATATLQSLVPDIPTLYKLWERLRAGGYEGLEAECSDHTKH